MDPEQLDQQESCQKNKVVCALIERDWTKAASVRFLQLGRHFAHQSKEDNAFASF
jgi:hypothetical protein